MPKWHTDVIDQIMNAKSGAFEKGIHHLPVKFMVS